VEQRPSQRPMRSARQQRRRPCGAEPRS
jgi:hypothetical protein